MEGKKTVFILESDEQLLAALTLSLKDKFILYSINRFTDFINLSQQVQANLIILEWSLTSAENNGLEIINKACPQAKILLIARDGSLMKLKDNNEIDAFLKKPFRRTELMKKLNSLL